MKFFFKAIPATVVALLCFSILTSGQSCAVDKAKWFRQCDSNSILSTDESAQLSQKLTRINNRTDGIRLYTALISDFELIYDVSLDPKQLENGFDIQKLKDHKAQFAKYDAFNRRIGQLSRSIQSQLSGEKKLIVHVYVRFKVFDNNRKEYNFHQSYVNGNFKDWEIIRTKISALDRNTSVLGMTDRIINGVETVIDKGERYPSVNLQHSITSNYLSTWYTGSSRTGLTGSIDINSNEVVYDYTGLFTNTHRSIITEALDGQGKVVFTDDRTLKANIENLQARLMRGQLTKTVFWFHFDRNNKSIKTQTFYAASFEVSSPQPSIASSLPGQLDNYIKTIFQESSPKLVSLADFVDYFNIQAHIFRTLTSLIGKAKIPQYWWDAAHPDYLLREWGRLIPSTGQSFAFMCGVWNGVINNLELISNIGLGLAELQGAFYKVILDANYRDELFGNLRFYYDNSGTLFSLGYELIKDHLKSGFQNQWEKLKNGDLTGVSYFTGQATVEVVIAIATAGAGSAVKAGLMSFRAVRVPVEFIIRIGSAGVKFMAWMVKQGVQLVVENGQYVLRQGRNIIATITLAGVLKLQNIRYLDNNIDTNIPFIELRLPGQTGSADEVVQFAKDKSGNVGVVATIGRFIAKTGLELAEHLKSLKVKPVGKTYNGDIYRSLSISSETQFGALPNRMTDHHIYSPWGRYDLPGEENAMYVSKTLTGNQTELVPHYGAWTDYSTYKYSNVQADNLLDLTDDLIRQQLGTEFGQLTKVLDDKAIMYEFTNELAKWARQNGYNGLIVPGARGAKNYENVVIFEQSYIDQILKDKTPTKIVK
jgi:hypothetical protein